jgi:probable HAF family extracellular repeat protein
VPDEDGFLNAHLPSNLESSASLKPSLVGEKIMKITPSSKIQSLMLVAALSIGLCFVSPVSARSYILDINSKTLTDLGTLGGDSTGAYDINDAGQVVGYSRTAAGDEHTFITGPNGVGMTDPNSLVELPAGIVLASAAGINNMGQIIVYASTIPTIPEPCRIMLFSGYD